MSIAKKFLIITLLIAGISVSAVTLLIWRTTTNMFHGMEGNRVMESVDSEARILQSTIDLVKSDMTILGEGVARHIKEEYSESRTHDLQMVADQLDTLMKERHAYRQAKMLFVADVGTPRLLVSTRINSVVTTRVEPAVADGENEALLAEKQGLRNFNVQTSSLGEEENGEKVLFLSLPIQSKDRRVIGSIAVIVAIEQVFSTLSRPQGDIAYWVADSTGQYLYQSRPQSSATYPRTHRNAIRDFQLSDTWDRLLSGAQPSLMVEFPAIAVMLCIRRVSLDIGNDQNGRNTLLMGATTSLAGLMIKVAAIQRQLAMTVGGVGLLMVLTLLLATGRLLRPIGDLTKVASRIASGDRDIVIPTSSHNEIDVLARAMTRMADELRQAGKKSEQTSMGQMASMIAHDLRNALSSVKMNLQILHSHHREEGNSQTENCEIALEQVRYMETILNDMLTFARPGAAQFDWVDLGEILRTASVSLLPEMTLKSIEFQMEEEQKMPTAMADRNKLLQLFQNILNNAIYAAPEWGHIKIRTRCLLNESRPAVEVRIEDDGPGISPQIADQVFEPFFTTSARGTGLGLAIVRRVVNQHGGKVYFDTAAVGGTTVVVLLPLTQEAQGHQELLRSREL